MQINVVKAVLSGGLQSVFKGKCVISEERMEVLWEMSEDQINELWA